jgi:hypothetical protein
MTKKIVLAKTNNSFLRELQKQAKLQSKLEDSRFFPRQLDWLMSFIGNYPWQFLLIFSGLSVFIWKLLRMYT